MDRKEAILDLRGGHCASCAFAIEHLGRKVPGISEVRVDTANSVIRVLYEGDPACLERIVEGVSRLGYAARLRPEGQSSGAV